MTVNDGCVDCYDINRMCILPSLPSEYKKNTFLITKSVFWLGLNWAGCTDWFVNVPPGLLSFKESC